MADPQGDSRRLALSPEAERWLAAACLLRNSDDNLAPLLVSQGWPEPVARAQLRALREHPIYQAAAFLIGRFQKLETVAEILLALRGTTRIERRAGVARSEFFARYYAENRPVILTDVGAAWPARRWTPDYLESVLGDAPVEVMTGRDASLRYDTDAMAHQHSVPFSEFATRVREGGASNDYYLVANNRLLDKPAAEPLWPDLEPMPEFMAKAGLRSNAFLWFGPAGTVTQLHHDLQNVLHVQLTGRKHFRMISPLHTHRVYNDVAMFSPVDPRAPDVDRFPLFAQVELVEFVLEPGEALFIPVAWWHHVEALETSISVSLNNFDAPNIYRW